MKRIPIVERIKVYCEGFPSSTTRYATAIELKNANQLLRLDKWNEGFAIKHLRDAETKLKASTVILKGRRLHGYFKWEVEKGYRSSNPINLKILPKNIDSRAPQALTLAETQKLIKHIPAANWIGLRDRLAVGLILTHGYRVSTLTSMNWEDIEVRGDGCFLHTKLKGGKLVTKKLRPDIVTLLNKFKSKTMSEL